MLPSPPIDWQILLAPDGLYAARLAWRWRGLPGRVLTEALHLPAASWSEALATLEPLLSEDGRVGRLHVTLSNRLVRYALVPWQAGLRGVAAQAYQRDCFARLYGDGALQWHIAAAPATRRSAGVASAIDGGLLPALQAVCQRGSVRLAAVQPQLAAVVNRWRRAMRGKCFWLVLAEPGHLCLALAHQRAWRAIRLARPAGDILGALGPLLEREALLADTDAVPTHVYLWARELETDDVDEVGGLPVTRLDTGAEHSIAALPACGVLQ